jgi:hypothetical protein
LSDLVSTEGDKKRNEAVGSVVNHMNSSHSGYAGLEETDVYKSSFAEYQKLGGTKE